MRLKIIRLVVTGLFVLIVSYLFYVQVIKGPYFFHLSKNNRIRVVPIEGWRGRIKDREGKLLADNRVAYNVMIMPQDVKDSKGLFEFLSEVLELDVADIEQTYRRKKFAPFAPVIVVEDVERQKAIVLEENRYRFPSLIIQETFQRFYPMDKNSAHVLGYVGKANRAKMERFKEYGYSPHTFIGYSGVEEFYDNYLKGENGGYQIEVNSRGQQVRLLSLKEPTKGQDIVLTIDSRIQEIMMGLLRGHIGVMIVMDRANGEILGMTSAPDFNPNIFVERRYSNQISRIFSQKSSPILNRAIKGVFPPGSVFKAVMAVAGLDSKRIKQNTSFVCPGFYELAGLRFGCTHQHGNQNLLESLAHSCNVYYYHLGLKLGADMIYRYARLLGLGSLTHIDLPYEEDGYIPSRQLTLLSGKRWYTGNTINVSIGQGDVLTTPLQLARMMSIVANNGIDVQPHIAQSVGGYDAQKNTLVHNVKIDPNVFETVQKGLRATVAEYSGTAHVLNITGMHIAGKTGTAQTSGNKEDHSWFVGYTKGQSRDIAFCVFLEHGGSSQNASLMARQLLLKMQREGLL